MYFSANFAITRISKHFRFFLLLCAASILAECLPVKINLQAVLGGGHDNLHCTASVINSHMVNFHQCLPQQVPGTSHETDTVRAMKRMNEQGVMRGL